MSRALKLSLAAGAACAVSLWTLAALGTWWLLQVAAGALDGASPTAALQTIGAWADRPWVRHWLDPQETAALLDGADWLLGSAGGPSSWLGTLMAWLGAALVVAWAGGLVLAALTAWATRALVVRLGLACREGVNWPWTSRGPTAGPVAGYSA